MDREEVGGEEGFCLQVKVDKKVEIMKTDP